MIIGTYLHPYEHQFYQPALLGLCPQQQEQPNNQSLNETDDSSSSTLGNVFDELSIWFAVPKSKITRSKKRMKTTVQKRIKRKQNIIIDPRTGEVTLSHRLPFNWKAYLPEVLTKPGGS